MDRNNPNVLYAALWEAYRVSYQMSSGGPGSGLWKTTDGGDNWTELTRKPGLPAGIIGRIGVAVSGADSNRVYALVENENGGVFRSDDGGETWTKTNDDRRLRQRAFYYTHIYADPKDALRSNTGFYKSPTAVDVSAPVCRGSNHDLWMITNPNRMINGVVVGRSVSSGQTWTDEDHPTAQFYRGHHEGRPAQWRRAMTTRRRAPSDGGGRNRAINNLYAVGGGERYIAAPDQPGSLRWKPGAVPRNPADGLHARHQPYPWFFGERPGAN
jgi:hypothetical protein